MEKLFKTPVEKMLASADIKINQGNSWGDIQVHNDKFYQRVLLKDSLGLGESYMEGYWDCEKGLDLFFYKIFSSPLVQRSQKLKFFKNLIRFFFNQQTKSKALKSVQRHYDKGNDLYRRMLDPQMIYSCGYWKTAKNLEEAQEHKLDLICRKLKLRPGQVILDIGCGWGGFAKYAAERYKVGVVGITLSENQYQYAKGYCKGSDVDIILRDYREMTGEFDHIVSVGMFEHVGAKNYKEYFNTALRLLKKSTQKEGGIEHLFLLHTIGSNTTTAGTDPWINKYIFPNSHIPSLKEMSGAMEGKFKVEDFHNFGRDYDKTLIAWQQNFQDTWTEISDIYGETFYRMWNYYLASCAGAFRASHIQLWQFVLSVNGVWGGYTSVR